MCSDERVQSGSISPEDGEVWRKNSEACSEIAGGFGDSSDEIVEDADSQRGVLDELKEPGVRD